MEEINLGRYNYLMFFVVSTCNRELRSSSKIRDYLSSLKRFNITPFFAEYDQRMGNLSKIFKMKELLDMLHYQDDDIIVDTDCFDVVFIRDPAEMVEKFKKENAERGVGMVVGAEINFAHSDEEVRPMFDERYHGAHYLNSGFKIGHVRVYHEILKEIVHNQSRFITKNSPSDQRVISRYCAMTNFRNDMIRLDVNSEYVTNISLRDTYSKRTIHSYCLHVTGVTRPRQQVKYRAILRDFHLS